ncbi:MAG: Sensor protein kinase WalK [Alphaproteobacteria bacterium MarineAlpha3_Bin4]|nr:MAG: Sensor protein kinase WalK [Alphaproteobacteria bacterium MarineAlpha3_Bin4]
MSERTPIAASFAAWFHQASVHRRLAYLLTTAAVVSGIATVVMMTSVASEHYSIRTVVNLLYIDGVILLLLGIVVARRIIQVWHERKKGGAGAGLHVRLAMLFSLVAVTPAIMVTIFSALFLNFGLQTWFAERVSTAIAQSEGVANAVLLEHRKGIQADAFAIANELNYNAPALMRNPGAFNRVLTSHAALRSLSVAVVVDGSGQKLGRSEYNLVEEIENISPAAVKIASSGQIAVLSPEKDDRVRALIRLNRFVDAYLLIERFVDSRVTGFIERTRQIKSEYQAAEKEQIGIQISFVTIFVIVDLLLLLSAVWIGLTVSTRIANPISNLITAAGRVSAGNLEVRVETTEAADEISSLSRAFNEMTRRLARQQQGLIDANRELDERRRFTETVLAGVSAGVVGLDSRGKINLPNRSASDLLATDLAKSTGRDLGTMVPEFANLLAATMAQPERMHKSEIKLVRHGQPRTLLVRIAAERLAGEVIGYVVTFDDVTELLSAQRKAAWADVARRIAHEIKNPLTPIQLSAERLKRKYMGEIQTNPEIFESCTETIIRQVEDIGRMVDEFSSFARMPQPSLKMENLSEVCRQTLFLEQNRHPEITFTSVLPEHDIELRCDVQQVARALTNLLKNAAESILGANDAGVTGDGKVTLTLCSADGARSLDSGAVLIVIEDNGKGLPEKDRDRLTEPYITTRAKGTGLGLAIVKKIMEDHNGDLLLADRKGGGAALSMVFRAIDAQEETAEGEVGKQDDLMKGAVDIALRGA